MSILIAYILFYPEISGLFLVVLFWTGSHLLITATRMVCSSLMRDSCVLEDDKTFFDYQIESRTTLKAQYLAEPEEQSE
mgnify:CR=1 FL=1